MKTDRPTRHYGSSYLIIVAGVIAVSALALIKLLLQGPFPLHGIMGSLFIGYVALGIMVKLGSYLTLTNTSVLLHSIFTLRPKRLPLDEIQEVHRERWKTFLLLGDTIMLIRTRNDECISIREAFYSTKTLRSFLIEFKTRAPGLIIDTQYQALIDGEIPATEAFKKLPTPNIIDLKEYDEHIDY